MLEHLIAADKLQLASGCWLCAFVHPGSIIKIPDTDKHLVVLGGSGNVALLCWELQKETGEGLEKVAFRLAEHKPGERPHLSYFPVCSWDACNVVPEVRYLAGCCWWWVDTEK